MAVGLVFATYYGGSREDRAVAIGVDRGGGVYVAGMTASRNFPVVRAVQPTSTSCPPVDQSQSSCGDAFVMHFDGTGAVVTFATYLGGSATVRALAVDPLGFAYIVGLNRGNTLPVRRAPQPDNAAGPVVVSEDGGRTWVGAAGLRAMSVGAIAWSTEARPVAYASTARGLFRSTDFGRSWIEWGGLTRSVGAVAVDPATPAILYASAGAFLKSLDGGRSWTDISGGLPENVRQYVGSIAIAPSQPSTLYVSANGRIYASDDGGSTWRGGAGTGWSVAVNPANPSRVYASEYNAGVKVSTDGARTWHTTFTVGREMYSGDIIINPMKPSEVYVALNTGVLRSVDSGETWQQIGSGWQEGPCSVAIDPTAPTDIWCAYHWINRLPASTSTFTFIDQPLAFIELMSANSGRVLASAAGASSGFVMSFDTSGAIAWSTYVGGTAGDPASDISAAGASVYVTGSTRSALWPLAQAGPRPFGGGSDLYIARYTIPR